MKWPMLDRKRRLRVCAHCLCFGLMVTAIAVFPSSTLSQVPPPQEVERVGFEAEGNVDNWIHLEGATLKAVVDAVSKITGIGFLPDEAVDAQMQSEVTVISNVSLAPELALQVLRAILELRQNPLALVPDPTLGTNWYRIVPKTETGEAQIPFVATFDQMPFTEAMVTYLYKLENADVQDAQLISILDQMRSVQGGQIIAYSPTNSILLMDTATNIRRMVGMIRVLDVPKIETVTEIFHLKFAQASSLAQTIQQVLAEEPVRGVTPTRTTPTRTTAGAAARQRTTAAVRARGGAVRTEELRVIPYEDRSIIVVCAEDMMTKVRELVAKLDARPPFERVIINFYPVKNQDAFMLSNTLSGLISGRGGFARRSGRGGFQTSRQGSTLGLRGTRGRTGGAFGNVQQSQLQQQGGGGAVVGGGERETPLFEDQIIIVPSESPNGLIITASQQDYEVLVKLLDQLDVPSAQVFLEAMILEVTLLDTLDIGVDMALLDEEKLLAATNLTGGSLPVLLSTAAALAAGQPTPAGAVAGFISGEADFVRTIPGLSGAAPGGASGLGDALSGLGLPSDLTGALGGTGSVVPNVPILLQILESLTDTNVVSMPSVLTLDNQPASFFSGLDVPIATGTSQRTDITATFVQQIEREDVGVTLEVVPQINEGDYVTLQIYQEIGNLVASPVGQDVNRSGPTFSELRAEAIIQVKNHDTAIIAGLIRDSLSKSKAKIPLLGDIPWLGLLFQARSQTVEKQNIVIMITPHIIRRAEELEELTGEKYDSLQEAAQSYSNWENKPGWPFDPRD